MKNFLVCLWATLVFWALIVFGPWLVIVMNNLGYWFSGGGWGPGSFMYKVLDFLSQPISCFIAYAAANVACKNEHPVCVMTNCIAAVCVCCLFSFGSFIAENMRNAAIMLLSAVCCIVTLVYAAKEVSEIRKKKKAFSAEVKKLKEEISTMEASLKDHDAAYSKNKEILKDAFSDEDLSRMVSEGSFPKDKVEEYISNRESLRLFILYAPQVRQSMVDMISKKKTELADVITSE